MEEVIRKAKPDIKQTSVQQYVVQLRSLLNIFKKEHLDFLDNFTEVKLKISHLHYTTQRNIYNSIIVYLQGLNDNGVKDETIKQYIDHRNELNLQYSKEQESGVISDKQSPNLVDISEINKMIDTLTKEVKLIKLKAKMTKMDVSTLRSWILLNMLTRIPTRNDASNMLYISQAMYNKLSQEDKENNNYLVNRRSGLVFIYNAYKTSKAYKENIIESPKDLSKMLRAYIKLMDFKVGDNIFPMTRNALSQLLLKTSKKYMGKSISTTMIRKSYLSSKYAGLNEEKVKDSKMMGHSISTQQTVYVKKQSQE